MRERATETNDRRNRCRRRERRSRRRAGLPRNRDLRSAHQKIVRPTTIRRKRVSRTIVPPQDVRPRIVLLRLARRNHRARGSKDRRPTVESEKEKVRRQIDGATTVPIATANSAETSIHGHDRSKATRHRHN